MPARLSGGWMHGDEPDNAQEIKDPKSGKTGYGPPVPPADIVAAYNALVQADPTRPVMLNLGQGVANDEWKGRGSAGKPSDYLTYVKGMTHRFIRRLSHCRQSDKPGRRKNYLWLVPRAWTFFSKWTSEKKIVWNCIECTHIGDASRQATPHQVKAEIWMSLIHGSTGLIYFVHQFKPKFDEHALLDDPPMLAAVTAINSQIHDLAPALNSPTIPGSLTVSSPTKDIPIDLRGLVKRQGEATYACCGDQAKRKTRTEVISVKGISTGEAEVIGETRTIPIRNGEFADDFAAYDVHLYRIKG